MKNIVEKGLLLLAVVSLFSCSTAQKTKQLDKFAAEVDLRLPAAEDADFKPAIDNFKRPESIVVKGDDGQDMILMNAVKDEETGEMVATEVLEAAVLTVRFKRVAERHGKVDLAYEIEVPEYLIDNQWQIRLVPELYLLDDNNKVISREDLEKIVITGEIYRLRQLREYQAYDRDYHRYADTMRYVRGRALEVFIERNLPKVYRTHVDSTYTPAADEDMANWYRCTEEEAIRHYSNLGAIKVSKEKLAQLDSADYITNPIDSVNVCLDSVVRSEDGNFIWDYVHTINTRPKLRKAWIFLAGDIYAGTQRIYRIPRTDSLEYNISSAGQLFKDQKRYIHKVIRRKAQANTFFNINFAEGKSNIDPRMDRNAEEMRSIKQTIDRILANTEFDLDSVVVIANCSPEGSWKTNEQLSRKRSQSVSEYFDRYMTHRVDSLNSERGFSVDEEGRVIQHRKIRKIRFKSRSKAENWDGLYDLVMKDSTMTEEDRQAFIRSYSIRDLDARENALKREPFYRHMRSDLYPKLRTVNFDFHLHRKGMVKDTIQTTELDTVYQKGVEALKDRDYDLAYRLLRNYPDDYNLAVVYVAQDKNVSAMNILENMPRTAEVNYLLALLYSRSGDDARAVQCYLDACKQEPTYKNRGNLDPEISVLIKTYGLNRQDDSDLY